MPVSKSHNNYFCNNISEVEVDRLYCLIYPNIRKNEILDLVRDTGHRYDGGISAYFDAVVDMLAGRGIPGEKK